MSEEKRLDGKDREEDEVLSDELDEAIEEIPDPKKRERLKGVIAQLSIQSTHYRGPIPDPEALKAYDEIVENGAERIITQFEEQSRHRRQIESIVINSQSRESTLGQIFAFIIALVCIGVGLWATLNGYETFGSILGGTTIVGLVTVFITGKKLQLKDLSEKK